VTKKIRFVNLKHFLPLKYFPHIASGICGARNQFVICWVMFISISCGRAHYLAHTYLIPSQGAHKSIPLKQVVHSTRNRRRVFWEIVQISNSILYVENTLGSYCRVSHAYLSHLVSTLDGGLWEDDKTERAHDVTNRGFLHQRCKPSKPRPTSTESPTP